MTALWTCESCDTLNRTRAKTCQVCHARKPVVAAVPSPKPKAPPKPPGRPKITVPETPVNRLPPPVYRPTTTGEPFVPFVATVRPAAPRPSPSRENLKAAKYARVAAYTVVVPVAIGHWVWRPLFGVSSALADDRLGDGLLATLMYLPEYLAGLAMVLLALAVFYLLPPRRHGRNFGLAIVAFTVLGAASLLNGLVRDVGDQMYEHLAVEQEAVPGHCGRAASLWSVDDYQWSLYQVGNCSDLVVYRGWRLRWRASVGKGRELLSVGHLTDLLVTWEGRFGRSSTVVVRDERSGRRLWGHDCKSAARDGNVVVRQKTGRTVKGRDSYIGLMCGKTSLFFAPSRTKKIFFRSNGGSRSPSPVGTS